jgi:hypothetical protein
MPRLLAGLVLLFVGTMSSIHAAEAPRTYPNSGGRLVWDRVRFLPAPGYERDMIGGKFTGSNVSATDGYETLAEIKTAPPAGEWREMTFDGQRPHRWIRYEAPPGSYGHIGKLEFYAGTRRLNGQGFGSIGAKRGGRDWPRVFDGKDTKGKFFMDADTPDGRYVGIDTLDAATAVRPIMDPPPDAPASPLRVTLRTPTPGAVIRYTLDGTTPGLNGNEGLLYKEPLAVDDVTTIVAVSLKEGFAPSSPTFGTYLVGPSVKPALSTFHIGNSLTGSTVRFPIYAETAGRKHIYQRYLQPGIWTHALWENDVMKTKDAWNKTFDAVTAVDHFTVQPRDPDIAHEAKFDILFFDLIRQKFPNMQPWFYSEWTKRDRVSPWDQATIPSPTMKTFPALTWEESAGAKLLYIEDLQRKVLETYQQEKSPRVLPTVMATGWVKNWLDHGKLPGLGPKDFDRVMFADGVHPGPEGSYLIDMVWYAAFYRESPEGKVLPVSTSLSTAQAAALQRLAWDVAKNYPDCGMYEEGTAPVGKPTFEAAATISEDVKPITLSSATPGAWFRYTLDGTEPTRTRGYVYCGIVSLRPGMTLKAIAYKSGMADSPVAALDNK